MFRKGRMNRATYWLILVLIVAGYAALIALDKKPPAILEVLFVIIGVPRLHDLGRSGWWMAAVIGLELVGIGLTVALFPFADLLVGAGLTVFAMLLAMIVLGLIPGEASTNAFGDVPAPGLSFGRSSS